MADLDLSELWRLRATVWAARQSLQSAGASDREAAEIHMQRMQSRFRGWFLGREHAVADALERAEEVADQGCEFCDAQVTDQGPEGEPHGHWWKCGECANRDATESSTVIGHLSDLLERAEWIEEALAHLIQLCGGISRDDLVQQMASVAVRVAPEPPSPPLTADEREHMLASAAWDVVEGINRCIREGQPPDLATLRWWGGHLAVARELARSERRPSP